MSQKDINSILWKECKDVFLSASNQNLRELLCEILGIVRKNYAFFHKIADLNCLWLSENDKQIMRLDNLLPASKDMVAQYEAKKNL